MGKIRTRLPVKLFIGMLSPEPELFHECASRLEREFGPVDYETSVLAWNETDYYLNEMGGGIQRKFIFFRSLIGPGSLADVKIFTNDIENSLRKITPDNASRRINLDPGYVTEAKVVLATTKDFSHRVYIGRNIYAEATLRYSSTKRSFTFFDHTYFDYRTKTYLEFFNRARDLLRDELKKQ